MEKEEILFQTFFFHYRKKQISRSIFLFSLPSTENEKVFIILHRHVENFPRQELKKFPAACM